MSQHVFHTAEGFTARFYNSSEIIIFRGRILQLRYDFKYYLFYIG